MPKRKQNEDVADDEDATPRKIRNDRSARKKSQRTLQEPAGADDGSGNDDVEQDEEVAQRILEDDGGSEAEDDGDEIQLAEATPMADTPSKPGKLRGRPKGRRRERTPSPPPDLPPHELYFFQNRTGANKTSSNTLPSHVLLGHDDYSAQVVAYKDPHDADIKRLVQYHKRAFNQWMFELEEGFNLCFYGYGSKRALMVDFAEHVYAQTEGSKPKIVVVNGYTPGLTMKDVLTTFSDVVLPKNEKLPAQPAAILEAILSRLNEEQQIVPFILMVNSLDHANLRKPAAQAMFAQLAAHQSVSFLATCDTPNFPLLWDLGLARQFHFLYHDATTFQPYKAENDVVEEVNALLGRSGRRLAGKDGVAYVLKSLPENARSLFRILVAEQLAMADIESNATAEGVEYRALYHKAVEEFVCSSELNFRTLLKEFHDHQMIESRKDVAGTERLIVPFRREELEAILDELV
ncbi:hypothetical protein BAUCODRAFT_121515 [Baudoinia panamericana UAMH 10762]|uniref:Origin recognition complex subunit 2 n=1 Tax=Baudoinia panamericana (strain UAMH 10762) TaxID=717646 RepID=M2LRD2_BAUPA|nr:uncharacterized protein BAUCODRAFT_121515 [Baudoinia panamericana UAMH 10762]EMC96987.1 hypothetical protein BAUCODRAFT_121515 [Baudoinia panamericana UAMH 10762]